MKTSGNSTFAYRSDCIWCSARIECEPGFEDMMSALIFESGFSGLEENIEDGQVVFTAFYPKSIETDNPFRRLDASIESYASILGKHPVHVLSPHDVPSKDWETEWRKGLGPVKIGSRLVILPSWVEYTNPDERLVIVIDPKMAFGTGGHATTRLCLKILEKIHLKDLSVLDAGCGSGVLSIAAAKLGSRCAIGFDNDPDSIRNARENVRINGVNNRVVLYKDDLTTVVPGHFDIVFANMISSVLIPHLGRFREFLVPEGTVVFSGLLVEEEKLFTGQLEDEGFVVSEVTRMDEWIAVKAQK